MGYDLHSRAGDCFEWQISDYPKALKLAEAYGWQPQGTTNSPVVGDGLRMAAGADPEDWNGGYTSNDCQIVSETRHIVSETRHNDQYVALSVVCRPLCRM